VLGFWRSRKKDPVPYSLWTMFDTQKEMGKAASQWAPRVFAYLLKDGATYDLEIVAVYSDAVEFSVRGPRLGLDSEPAQIRYMWHRKDLKDKKRASDADRLRVASLLRDRYKGAAPAERQMAQDASEIVGSRIYIAGGQ
jgi:hypothetical protein